MITKAVRLRRLLSSSPAPRAAAMLTNPPPIEATVPIRPKGQPAIESPSCHGARMTGAGFGGSAIALVDRDATKEFVDSVRDSFYNRTRRHAVLYPVLPSQGLQISDT
jgi:GHMP kinases C terminal